MDQAVKVALEVLGKEERTVGGAAGGVEDCS